MDEFKLIVAGGRDFNDPKLLCNKLFELAEGVYKDKAVSIVSGMARGADIMAYHTAIGNDIKVYSFPANWDKYGKGAGYRRNEDMARFADGLLAFHDGVSRGTANMIQIMQRLHKDVHVVKY